MEKLDGKTFDVVSDNIKKLKELFPEIVTEGKVDIDKLVLLFDKTRNEDGESSKDGEERYEFIWKGKKEAIRMAQKQTTGTLRPCKEESVNFDDTQNLYIEGDNLEVLRALQSSYRGKIKMIYIDPPYNTGQDFIYKDNFGDNVKNYKEKMNESYKTNTDNSGRFHTDWLNMIYPRLKLAKNLLTEDGAIFISIDDNELTNLKKICDEIFGEKNFIANFTWIKKKKGSHLSKTVRSMTEYVLAYSKNIANTELFGEEAYSDKWQPLAKRTNAHKVLKFNADVLETKLNDGYYEKGTYGEGSSSITFNNGFKVINNKVITEVSVEGPFVWTQKKLDDELNLGTRVALSSKFGFNALRSDQADKVKRPTTILDNRLEIGTNEDAYAEGIEIFNKENIMSYPKPTSLVKYIINTLGYYDKDMIILDFFSGSGSTAHSVMQLNAKDGGNRKFIMVQLPEETDEKSEAYKAGYKTICEIGKERIRRAGQKVLDENKDKEGIEDLDIGFKVFKLDTTNIKEWDDTIINTDEIKWNVEELINPIKDGRSKEDVIYEILLKYGVDLTMPIEKIEIIGSEVYSVGFGYLMICLEKDISLDLIEAIGQQKPNRVVLYDNGLDNESKTNGERILKELGVKDIRTI